ncbi:murein biosynthesis integral membrane protein MurJ [Litoreibacter arenae]|uniref:Probable lipid II flippase MurJ n=1 Tax=Litoreibacter arenae DSM 19593 TaxID=1123360 RepID=S9QPM9_9RHOB|nr:murein biosynthesis integral membrane protein MurJ [Litoreibacter arenae]EPX81548.1 putative peptidoglycan lipid II flippase MurJ [Litoreibacter arenae DSM 19593]
MSQSNRLMRGFATVGVWTLLSRILGFVRDVLIAGFLGAGPVAEAFLIAFSLPNMFRRFFAEGAFNMAFVPMFSKKLEAGDDPETFARDAFTGLGTLLIFFTVIAQIFMPALVLLMASGFVADERFELATLFGRIAFPYILFISLAALLSGVLNATGRFVAAAAAPVLLNVLFILSLTATWALGADIGLALAWTVPLAGFAQLALVWVAASRAGFRLIPRRPRLTPELKRLAIIAAPAALAGGVVQVNLLVGRNVASWTEGAIAWVNYADRLYQLPLGVVAIAIGVVLLPELSRRLQADDVAGGQDALSRAGEVALALTVPCAVALMVIPSPMISVLFERGRFTAEDTAATALAVAIYGMGLPAFVLQKIFQPLYFAREDTKRPFYFAVVSMVINVVVAVGLWAWLDYLAAALATSLAGWGMAWLLWHYSRGFGQAATFDARFRTRAPRIIAASVLMGAFLYAGNLVLRPLFEMGAWRYLALAILLVSGGVFYAFAGRLLGAFTPSDLKRSLRR